MKWPELSCYGKLGDAPPGRDTTFMRFNPLTVVALREGPPAVPYGEETTVVMTLGGEYVVRGGLRDYIAYVFEDSGPRLVVQTVAR